VSPFNSDLHNLTYIHWNWDQYYIYTAQSSVRLYLQLFVGGLMSYLCYLCCVYSFCFSSYCVPYAFLRIVYPTFFFVLCTLRFSSYSVPYVFLRIVYPTFFFVLCTLRFSSYCVPYVFLRIVYPTFFFALSKKNVGYTIRRKT
jgi:hypothetical protein